MNILKNILLNKKMKFDCFYTLIKKVYLILIIITLFIKIKITIFITITIFLTVTNGKNNYNNSRVVYSIFYTF